MPRGSQIAANTSQTSASVILRCFDPCSRDASRATFGQREQTDHLLLGLVDDWNSVYPLLQHDGLRVRKAVVRSAGASRSCHRVLDPQVVEGVSSKPSCNADVAIGDHTDESLRPILGRDGQTAAVVLPRELSRFAESVNGPAGNRELGHQLLDPHWTSSSGLQGGGAGLEIRGVPWRRVENHSAIWVIGVPDLSWRSWGRQNRRRKRAAQARRTGGTSSETERITCSSFPKRMGVGPLPPE
jgi:hypothetical protein